MKRRENRRVLSKDWVLTAALVVIFVLLKLWTLGPKISDENVYLYSAWLLSKGVVPYRDFFYAHLPGQLMDYAVIFSIFGKTWAVFKAYHLLVVVGCGWLMRELLRSAGITKHGYLVMGLWLFSNLVLGTSDILIGAYEAVFLFLFGWLMMVRDKPIVSGSMWIAALFMRLYIAPAMLAVAVYHFVWEKRNKALTALVFLTMGFGLANLFLHYQFGEAFLDSVWRYHLAKTRINLTSFSDFVKGEKFLALIALLSAAALARKVLYKNLILSKQYAKKPRTFRFGVEAVLTALIQIGVLRMFSGSFLIYYITAVPLLSLMTVTTVSLFVAKRSLKLVEVLLLTIMVYNSVSYLNGNALRYRFEALPQVVKEVKEISAPGDTIFGQALVTPLVALESGREISDYEADTNTQRYMLGSLPAEKATKLATESAVFLQSVELDINTGKVGRIDPAFVDSRVLIEHCKPFARYPLEQGFGFNYVVVWQCGGIKD